MLLALPGGGGGGRLAHDVSDAHVDGLGGGQGHVAGQQRGLLHDGVVVAAVGVRVPAQRGHTGTRLKCNRRLLSRLFHRPPPSFTEVPSPPGPAGFPVFPGWSVFPGQETEGVVWAPHSAPRAWSREVSHSSQTVGSQAAALLPSAP